jgi:hypothetical protein
MEKNAPQDHQNQMLPTDPLLTEKQQYLQEATLQPI